MTEYKVIEIIRIGSGRIGLSAKQASKRQRGLTKDGDFYTIKKPIEFKVGEVINLDGPLDKYLATKLEAVGFEVVGGPVDEPSVTEANEEIIVKRPVGRPKTISHGGR